MELNEAIKHARDVAENRTDLCEECRVEHRQLAEWLEQLKKLTEENKDLRATVKVRGETIESLQMFVSKITEENERLRAENAEQDEAILRALNEMGKIRREARADTVRKMQEKVEKAILSINPNLCGLLPFIDQIAKEMLEATDEV